MKRLASCLTATIIAEQPSDNKSVLGAKALEVSFKDPHNTPVYHGKNHIMAPAEGSMSFPATEIDVLNIAAKWLAAGHKVALATVVKTSGSAPRQTGSHIAIRDDGAFAGSVSAGCVEGAIIEEALAALADGRHRTLRFGVSDEGVLETGLLCGGEIEIFVEPIL